MESLSATHADYRLNSSSGSIVNNTVPVPFNARNVFIATLCVQLQKLEEVKTQGSEINARETTKEKRISAATDTTDSTVLSTFLSALFVPLIASVVVASLLAIFVGLIASLIFIAHVVLIVVVAAIMTWVLLKYSSASSASSAHKIDLFSKDYRKDSLCEIELIADDCFLYDDIPKDDKNYCFFCILMDLHNLELVNRDSELSNHINKLYVKMHRILALEDIAQKKLFEYAEKFDNGDVEYFESQIERYTLLKRKARESLLMLTPEDKKHEGYLNSQTARKSVE